ncbi:hypothetical protein MVES1_003899 [Malassezia vespertilionis]|nr:uncharacterized protein MVES1_003899 [Malassezia vespertilionis]WFD08523.1 hypothetical protein MVES1_003899 [Malassezia vespertilionis]
MMRLFLRNCLPKDLQIFGYARSKMTQEEFHERLSPFLPGTSEEKEGFLKICKYIVGSYDEDAAFQGLTKEIEAHETKNGGEDRNRLFYMALPPNVFTKVSAHLKKNCYSTNGTNRIVVEKPFGKDLDSCKEMIAAMKEIWTEQETFRIDHYLGKEMIKNIINFRFSNPTISESMSNKTVDNVQITFKEPFGTEGRGGYFDEFGIIRDIEQNHLCQVFCLMAMEEPKHFTAEAIRDAKVNVLKQTKTISTDDVLIGQYSAANGKPGYKDDDTVPKDSVTPTFAALVLHVDNERWKGVPFILKAGKALDEGKVDVRVQYKSPTSEHFKDDDRNELVIRIQPKEAIYLKSNVKIPGQNNGTVPVELDLTYSNRFTNDYIPEAYESLIYDCLRGDHANFVRDDELFASWSIFTPVLHAIDAGKVPVKPYAYGSHGPAELEEFIAKYGYKRMSNYEWSKTNVGELEKRLHRA